MQLTESLRGQKSMNCGSALVNYEALNVDNEHTLRLYRNLFSLSLEATATECKSHFAWELCCKLLPRYGLSRSDSTGFAESMHPVWNQITLFYRL